MNENAPKQLGILGVEVGTYTGWDEVGDWMIQFYNFVGNKTTSLPDCEFLVVDYQTGIWQASKCAENGEDLIEIGTGSIVKTLFEAK